MSNNNFTCLSDDGKMLYGTAAILHGLHTNDLVITESIPEVDYSADLEQAEKLMYELGYLYE